MGISGKYLYVVMMDVEPETEALFNEVYDEEHIPALLKVPGVLSAARFKTGSADRPKYLAIYELTNSDVPETEAFIRAVESGRWPHDIRPFTKNRSRTLYSKIS